MNDTRHNLIDVDIAFDNFNKKIGQILNAEIYLLFLDITVNFEDIFSYFGSILTVVYVLSPN
jgi:hypothetical protein